MKGELLNCLIALLLWETRPHSVPAARARLLAHKPAGWPGRVREPPLGAGDSLTSFPHCEAQPYVTKTVSVPIVVHTKEGRLELGTLMDSLTGMTQPKGYI